jgi:hypothetical protein
MAKSAQTRSAEIGKTYQILSVVGPTQGMDLRTSPTLLAPERARNIVNFSLGEPGALVVRKGYDAFSTTSLGSSRAQGGARVYLNTALPSANSTAFTLVAWGQSVYVQSDSGGWSSAVLTGLSTNEVSFPSDRNLVAAFDGSTGIRKSTNGSSWTRFGIVAPAAGPNISTLSTGGVSSGEYEIAYTFKDRDLVTESNGSGGSTITLSASSGALSVVVANSTDPQVDAVVIYARKVTSGESVLRKVSSQAQSAGTNSTIVVTSTSWTTNDEIPTDHDVAPGLSFGVVWKNRWWARSSITTNRLHFTQLFQPQSWPALFYVDIPFERGDAIQALVPLGDALLVFGTTKIFVIIGQTSLDFEVRPTIASEDGAFGFRSVAVIENGVMHASASGVYTFDGTQDKLLSFDLEPAWKDLVANASASDLRTVAMTYHKSEKELRIAVPRRYPSGSAGEFVLDLNQTRNSGKTAWSATDRQIGGYIQWDGPEDQAGNRGRLFSWHTTTGQLFEEAVGQTANSSNITAEYEGPGLTLGVHRGRWVDARVEYEPHGGAFSIEPVVDGVTKGSKSLTIAGGGAEYGDAEYGVDDYGGGVSRKQAYTMFPLSADGRTCVLKAVYVGQEAFKMYSYHLGLVPETKSRSFAG